MENQNPFENLEKALEDLDEVLKPVLLAVEELSKTDITLPTDEGLKPINLENFDISYKQVLNAQEKIQNTLNTFVTAQKPIKDVEKEIKPIIQGFEQVKKSLDELNTKISTPVEHKDKSKAETLMEKAIPLSKTIGDKFKFLSNKNKVSVTEEPTDVPKKNDVVVETSEFEEVDTSKVFGKELDK